MTTMPNTPKNTFVQQTVQLNFESVKNCISLLDSGCTLPFIARYRKDATNGLNEVEIEKISNAISLWNKIESRRNTIIKNLLEQEKLTEELKNKLQKAISLTELEDLFLPFKTKTQTKSSIALQNGLKPIAVAIMKQNDGVPEIFANKLTSTRYPTNEAVLEGAIDICADWINQNEWLRNRLRKLFWCEAQIKTKLIKGQEENGEKFTDFFNFSEHVKRIKPHRFMAVRRGKNLGVLRVTIAPEKTEAIEAIKKTLINSKNEYSSLLQKAIKQAYTVQLKPSLERELFNELAQKSDDAAISIFRKNLEQLLMTAPVRGKKILAIDPGFKSGCKVVCLSKNGELEHNETIYPHAPQHDSKALSKVNTLVRSYKIEAIAIGNGTASRETEKFIKQIRFDRDIQVYVVSEAGASVYSASRVARTEFPNYDVTVRGAVSIGRRLMDPLSELVKIDPKALGVGQYQHDITSTLLEQGLTRTIENCVNKVGVELNSSSSHLLTYVSGLGVKTAQAITTYRSENGPFKTKLDLLKVNGLGEKAFEQCAGFIRIENAKNPLDNSAIHPESFDLVNKIAASQKLDLQQLIGNKDVLSQINLEEFISENYGKESIKFILNELEKPNRDPRKHAEIFEFKKNLKTIQDLREGEIIPGIVSNITGFGAFVDIGIKENGLIHLSELANEYVSDPNEYVQLNQTLQVRVKSIDIEKKRIALSLKGISFID